MQIMVNTIDCRISLLVHGFLLILMHFLMWKKKSSEKLVCVFFLYFTSFCTKLYTFCGTDLSLCP